jgi:hypothetical protein
LAYVVVRGMDNLTDGQEPRYVQVLGETSMDVPGSVINVVWRRSDGLRGKTHLLEILELSHI